MRNPLERLVSAYRDKLANGDNDRFAYTVTKILAKYKHISNSSTLDFQMYIRWIIDTPNDSLDQHFKPLMYLVHPCAVKYDFFGNFKHLSSDLHLVMEKFNISSELYRDQGYYGSGPNTTTLLPKYYSTVSVDLKQKLVADFSAELDFYYHLFPEEKNSLFQLLGLNP